MHTSPGMRQLRTLALLAALLLGMTGRGAPRPLELHLDRQNVAANPLREIPTVAAERPSPDALLTQLVDDVTVPGPDGKPTLVVRSVRGGLVLGWARLW